MGVASAMARSLLAPLPPSSSSSSSGPRSGLAPLLPNPHPPPPPPQALCLSRPTSFPPQALATKWMPLRCASLHRFSSSDDGAAIQKQELPIEKRFPPFPTVMDIHQICSILPHRFPFLLIDRVIEYKHGVSAVGIKNVTINENFFPGHFPDRPIMPGVLMVEALAQVGGIVLLQPGVGGSPKKLYLAGLNGVRFRKPVSAGDTLIMRMTLVKLQKQFEGMAAKMEGKAYVGGEVVCEGEFLMAGGTK